MIDEMNDYIAELEVLGRKPSYIRGIRTALNDFMCSMGGSDDNVDMVSEQELKKWIQDMRNRELKDVSIKLSVALVKRFFDYLIESPDHVYTKTNLCARIYGKLNHGRTQTRRPFKTVEQIAQMIKSAYMPRDRALLTVLAKTGIRRSEIIGLNVSDVDFKDSLLNVDKHYDQSHVMIPGRKNGVSSVIPLDAETIKVLKTYIAVRQPVDDALFVSRNGLRLDGGIIYDIVKAYAEKSGMGSELGPHYFRAWATYILAMSGCKPEVVQWIRGDAPDTMANFYTHQILSLDDVRREFLRCVPQFGL